MPAFVKLGDVIADLPIRHLLLRNELEPPDVATIPQVTNKIQERENLNVFGGPAAEISLSNEALQPQESVPAAVLAGEALQQSPQPAETQFPEAGRIHLDEWA